MELAKNEMTHFEAKECVTKINQGLSNVRALILDLYERRGWEALGYKSWKDCVGKEFKQYSQSYLYYQKNAALIERNISTKVENVEPIPETHLRPLTSLEPEQQIEAWAEAQETAPASGITASHVEAVAAKFKNKPKKKEKENGKQLMSGEFKDAYEVMLREIKNAKALKWKTTSKEAALQAVNVLVDVITIR